MCVLAYPHMSAYAYESQTASDMNLKWSNIFTCGAQVISPLLPFSVEKRSTH